jgi:hypothetical protein
MEQHQTKKDIWEKLSSISNLIAGVLIAGAGTLATILYNNRQLDLQEHNSTIQTQIASSQHELQRLQFLEPWVKYVTSDKPELRRFGYAMFATVGQETLAAKLIGYQNDIAGGTVLNKLAKHSDESVRDVANNELFDLLDQLKVQSSGRLSPQGVTFLRENWVIHSEPCLSIGKAGGWIWAATYTDGFMVYTVVRNCRGTFEIATYFLGLSSGDCDSWYMDASGNQKHVCFPGDARNLFSLHGAIVAIQRMKFISQ